MPTVKSVPVLSSFATISQLLAVSGSLQNQIDNHPGIWTELVSFSTSIPDKDSVVTVSGIPAMDVLKVFVFIQGLGTDPMNIPLVLYFNDDFNYLNYSNAELILLRSPIMTAVPLDCFMERTIVNRAETRKISYISGIFAEPADYDNDDNTINWGSGWENSTDRISSMSFGFSTDTPAFDPIISGSVNSLRVKICGMNF